MLKDRIVVDENGFQVNRESADPERKALLMEFMNREKIKTQYLQCAL